MSSDGIKDTFKFDQFGRDSGVITSRSISSVVIAAALVVMRHIAARPRCRFCATQNSRSIANNLRGA